MLPAIMMVTPYLFAPDRAPTETVRLFNVKKRIMGNM